MAQFDENMIFRQDGYSGDRLLSVRIPERSIIDRQLTEAILGGIVNKAINEFWDEHREEIIRSINLDEVMEAVAKKMAFEVKERMLTETVRKSKVWV